MKCARLNCPNKGGRGSQNLCDTHYKATRHGWVDSTPAVAHYKRLRKAGLSVRRISELTGLHRGTLAGMGKWTAAGRIEVATRDAVLGVPLPRRIIDGGGLVDSSGTRRRLQALMLSGHTRSSIGAEIGVSDSTVGEYMSPDRKSVTSRTAFAVAEVCGRWWDVPGPSAVTAARARRSGWVPFLAWDDIDNPDEVPRLPADGWLTFEERLAELEYLHIRRSEMPAWLGIQAESFERNLSRQKLKEAV